MGTYTTYCAQPPQYPDGGGTRTDASTGAQDAGGQAQDAAGQ
jgi:hypothetical protein